MKAISAARNILLAALDLLDELERRQLSRAALRAYWKRRRARAAEQTNWQRWLDRQDGKPLELTKQKH